MTSGIARAASVTPATTSVMSHARSYGRMPPKNEIELNRDRFAATSGTTGAASLNSAQSRMHRVLERLFHGRSPFPRRRVMLGARQQGRSHAAARGDEGPCVAGPTEARVSASVFENALA